MQVFLFLCSAISTLLICSRDSTYASTSKISEALQLSDSHPEKSLELLKQIPIDDSHFKLAVEESLKLLYRLQDWPSFFGYAQYYRKRWTPTERNRTQLLELLALLRHCQNESLEKIIDAYKKILPKESEKLDEILSLSKTKFRGKPAKGEGLGSMESHLKGVSLWPIEREQILKVDPVRLKVKVENLCSF